MQALHILSTCYLFRLGIRKEDLPKYEEQLELKIAKAELEELKQDALEAMETQKKRYIVFLSEFKPYAINFLIPTL